MRRCALVGKFRVADNLSNEIWLRLRCKVYFCWTTGIDCSNFTKDENCDFPTSQSVIRLIVSHAFTKNSNFPSLSPRSCEGRNQTACLGT